MSGGGFWGMAFRSQMIVAVIFFILGLLAFAFRQEVLGWIIMGIGFLWDFLLVLISGWM